MKFKAGTYYIGDPCYVIQDKDENWDQFLKNYYNHKSEFKGFSILVDETAYGDGSYRDNVNGVQHLVDSGLLSVMPIELIKQETKKSDEELLLTNEHSDTRGYSVITFEEDFDATMYMGVLVVGHIVIDTAGGEDEEETGWEEDDWGDFDYE
jgi:hypothetical protein